MTRRLHHTPIPSSEDASDPGSFSMSSGPRRRWPRRPGFRLSTRKERLGACAFAVLGGGAITTVKLGTRPSMVMMIALVLLIPVMRRFVQGRLDIFEPIVAFTVAYGILFVVRPAADLATTNFTYTVASASFDVTPGYTKMLVIGLLGAIGFIVGYESHIGGRMAARLRPPVVQFDDRQAARLSVGLAVVGAVLFALYVRSQGLSTYLAGRGAPADAGAFSRTSSYLPFGSFLLSPAALMLLALGWRRRSRTLVFAGALVGAALVAGELPQGGRLALLPLILGVAVLRYLLRGRRPHGILVVLVALVALSVSAFIVGSRDTSARQSVGYRGTLQALAANPARVFTPLTTQADAAEAPGLAAVLQMIPQEIPHAYGVATFGDLLTRPIPRSLWAGKPLSTREQVIFSLIRRDYSLGVANPEFTALLIPFIDWGYAGVLLVLAAYGVMARLAYERWRSYAQDIVPALMLALTLPVLVIGLRDGLVDTFARAVFLLGPVWLVFRLARVSNPQGA